MKIKASRIDEILDFWFGRADQPDPWQRPKVWFVADPNFDREILARFPDDYEKAVAGKLNDWQESPRGCLALIIILDQFPRNLFRNDPKSYATDAQALGLAEYAVAKGFDRELQPVERLFIYLPFGHSENIDHQKRGVDLYQQIGTDPKCAFIMPKTIKHLEVIERFGRFPHRNAILGRTTTSEEAEFLAKFGSGF